MNKKTTERLDTIAIVSILKSKNIITEEEAIGILSFSRLKKALVDKGIITKDNIDTVYRNISTLLPLMRSYVTASQDQKSEISFQISKILQEI